jgi:hypothetical protein
VPSLDPHVVLDGLHARHPACDFDCLVDVRLRPDEAAQLDSTLERFDVDLVDLTAGSLKIAVFTFVVITESSTYSHEELTLRVELQCFGQRSTGFRLGLPGGAGPVGPVGPLPAPTRESPASTTE